MVGCLINLDLNPVPLDQTTRADLLGAFQAAPSDMQSFLLGSNFKIIRVGLWIIWIILLSAQGQIRLIE